MDGQQTHEKMLTPKSLQMVTAVKDTYTLEEKL